ncbi:class I SAM-dependent methyltransferase [Phenylobacterium sp.]|jgi:2-polyprenyl-3-methyl-5-hydroxy-6-metoxy-1,4-benzoquinol methylase|uniref:class I SAM-dependent methyltransferase n=1 Tax=Phenylobacterium sp. TaxID=1871053 RepID=UPI002F4052EB
MPLLSDIAQHKKIRHFLEPIPKSAAILEIGCGSRWVGDHLRANGWRNYVGVDLQPPADIVGDIREWRSLGLGAASFDVVIALEVIEHVDILQEAFDLLASGGRLMMTSPVPRMDWAMQFLEFAGLNQKRTSPHCNLTDFERLPLFERLDLRRPAGLAQWGIFRKPLAALAA